jgi:hypothetical protein
MSGLEWHWTGRRLSDIVKSWRSAGGLLGRILATTAPSSASRTPNGVRWCAPGRRSTPSRTGDPPPPSGSGTSWSPMPPPCSASTSRAPRCAMPLAASRTGNAGALLARSVGLPLVVDDLEAHDLVHTLVPRPWSRGVPDVSHDPNRILIEQKIRIGTNAIAQVLHCPPNRGQPKFDSDVDVPHRFPPSASAMGSRAGRSHRSLIDWRSVGLDTERAQHSVAGWDLPASSRARVSRGPSPGERAWRSSTRHGRHDGLLPDTMLDARTRHVWKAHQ